MTRPSAISALALALVFAGCGSGGEADGGPDVGPPADLGPVDFGPPDFGVDGGPDMGPDQGPMVELTWGTGREAFRAIELQEELPFIEPQGQGFSHVELAFRATVFEPGTIFVALDCTRQRDGFDEVCERTLTNETALAGPDGMIEVLDQRLLIPDAELDAVGEILDVTVRLQNEDGLTVNDEFEVVVVTPAE